MVYNGNVLHSREYVLNVLDIDKKRLSSYEKKLSIKGKEIGNENDVFYDNEQVLLIAEETECDMSKKVIPSYEFYFKVKRTIEAKEKKEKEEEEEKEKNKYISNKLLELIEYNWDGFFFTENEIMNLFELNELQIEYLIKHKLLFPCENGYSYKNVLLLTKDLFDKGEITQIKAIEIILEIEEHNKKCKGEKTETIKETIKEYKILILVFILLVVLFKVIA